MENRTKILIGIAGIALLLTVYMVNSEEVLDKKVIHVTNGNKYENIEEQKVEVKVKEKITNVPNSENKPNILNYKDVFKDPKPLRNSLDEIVEQEELKKLDEEVDDVISEADALIKKENLILAPRSISEEKRKEQENKIDDLEKKLSNIE